MYMSTPEVLPPEVKPEAPVQQVPETVIPREVEQGTGVQNVQQQPQQLVADDGQVTAQPVPPPVSDQPQIKIPAQSQQQLADLSKGSINDSGTWFGVYWLRRVKVALQNGMQAIFGE